MGEEHAREIYAAVVSAEEVEKAHTMGVTPGRLHYMEQGPGMRPSGMPEGIREGRPEPGPGMRDRQEMPAPEDLRELPPPKPPEGRTP